MEQTDLKVEGGGGMEEVNQRTYMHILVYISQGHVQQCDEDRRCGGGWVEENKGERAPVILSTTTTVTKPPHSATDLGGKK